MIKKIRFENNQLFFIFNCSSSRKPRNIKLYIHNLQNLRYKFFCTLIAFWVSETFAKVLYIYIPNSIINKNEEMVDEAEVSRDEREEIRHEI